MTAGGPAFGPACQPHASAAALVADIYLPKWFAHNMPTIHTPLLVFMTHLHAWNLRRSRGLQEAVAMATAVNGCSQACLLARREPGLRRSGTPPQAPPRQLWLGCQTRGDRKSVV